MSLRHGVKAVELHRAAITMTRRPHADGQDASKKIVFRFHPKPTACAVEPHYVELLQHRAQAILSAEESPQLRLSAREAQPLQNLPLVRRPVASGVLNRELGEW